MIKSLLVVLVALLPMLSSAQTYPTKAITLIVPFPPGGTTDVLARSVGDRLSKTLGKPVIVENRTGAGGNIGAEAVANAKPDGYTLMLSSAGPLAINANLYPKVGYDMANGFAPVIHIADVPIMLVVNPKQPFRSVSDLLTAARAAPGKLSYSSQGNGTTSHLSMELLKQMAKIDVVHVPYRGSAPASQALIAGDVQVMFDNSPTTLPHVKQGSMRALGIASKKRSAAAPDVPTIGETVKGFESTAWFGIVAPARTPVDIVTKLNTTLNAILKEPEMVSRFNTLGAELVGGTPEAFGQFIRAETAKWDQIIKASGAKAD